MENRSPPRLFFISNKSAIEVALTMDLLNETQYRFLVGDLCLLVDRKDRRYLLTLTPAEQFHSHSGFIEHDDIIGAQEGTNIKSSKGSVFLAVRPTLSEYSVMMQRGPTPIYTKDIGAILAYGDIYPGSRVVEAGTGSAALTMALLQAVGDHGHIFSYEVREDFLEIAKNNLLKFERLNRAQLTLQQNDIYQGINEQDVDRIVLDLPEPWEVIPHAETSLRPGGILVSYVPTTLQLHRVWESLDACPGFGLIEQFELIHRPWEGAKNSLRPSHRMVGHTGFITTARRISQG